MPPAPIDEILSFIPTHKLNFVAQVGLNGIPLIKTSTSPAKHNGKDKIFVLGREYSADILKSANGPGATQPQTKLVNGYFQLATDVNKNNNNEEEEEEEEEGNGNEENETGN